MDIAGNYWEYSAEKSFYQMLLGGVDYLLLGVLLNNEYVINKEEYDLVEVHTKVKPILGDYMLYHMSFII